MSPRYLFVYGTLRRDPSNEMYHILARGSRFVGDAAFPGDLYDLGKYPGAVPTASATHLVKGEVYEILDPGVLETLDEYEDARPAEAHEPEFRREIISITLADGKAYDTWVYLCNRPVDGLPRIASGDYLEYRRRRPTGTG